jgi:hypothetical protein
MPSPRKVAAGKVNILTRHRAADDPDLIEARREHAVLAIEDSIQRIVDAAPPLGPEQIDRLRGIFRTVTDVAGAA